MGNSDTSRAYTPSSRLNATSMVQFKDWSSDCADNLSPSVEIASGPGRCWPLLPSASRTEDHFPRPRGSRFATKGRQNSNSLRDPPNALLPLLLLLLLLLPMLLLLPLMLPRGEPDSACPGRGRLFFVFLLVSLFVCLYHNHRQRIGWEEGEEEEGEGEEGRERGREREEGEREEGERREED